MFESRADEIVQNVRELSRLDPEYGSVSCEFCSRCFYGSLMSPVSVLLFP